MGDGESGRSASRWVGRNEDMNYKRPIILVFNLFYLPGYRAGGPIRTLSNMTERLGGDFDFRIVTLDRDIGDNQPYPNIPKHTWNVVGRSFVRYVSQKSFSFIELTRIIKDVEPDFIYINSFFDPTFTQRVLWVRRLGLLNAIPVILAPRGELSSGALSLKPLRKRIYIFLSHLAGLYRGLTWHASSAAERGDIQKTLPFVSRDNVREAMNLAPAEDGATAQRNFRQEGEPLRVCFLGRIAPMKNLDFALRSLAGATRSIHFTIFGPKESVDYWHDCVELIARLPSHIEVTYRGELQPSVVKSTLAKHDLFFLPTRGENYGHVIHEALTAGLPVLISDQTPWHSLESAGVGWELPLDDPKRFAQKIDMVADWSEVKHQEVAKRAIRYSSLVRGDSDVLTSNRALFLRTD